METKFTKGVQKYNELINSVKKGSDEYKNLVKAKYIYFYH